MLYTFSLPNSIVFLLNISFSIFYAFVMYVISIFTVVCVSCMYCLLPKK